MGHDTPCTPYEVEPLPVVVMAHLLLMRILSAVAGLPTILWALPKPKPVRMWMRCRNPDKRKDALDEVAKKMGKTGIGKSKFRISSVWQKEKHLQMNVSA